MKSLTANQAEYIVNVTRDARLSGITKDQFLQWSALAWEGLEQQERERRENFRHCPECGTPEGGLHDSICPALSRAHSGS